jgi:hypothetical protein
MSTPPAPGPTGLSAKWKYVAIAVLTIGGVVLGQLMSVPVITAGTVIAAVVYVIPTAISEFEGA